MKTSFLVLLLIYVQGSLGEKCRSAGQVQQIFIMSTRNFYSVRQMSGKIYKITMRAFVVFSNGKNVTIGRQIPFKVLPMVPLVMPLVPMVPMLPTYGSKWCRQNTAWVILPTREKSRDSIWRA